MTIGVEAMAIERALVAVVFAESLTCTVKLLLPDAVGVPDIAPAAERVRPAGRAPALTVHEYPPVPPDAARDCA
jgi:hypothetical protein